MRHLHIYIAWVECSYKTLFIALWLHIHGAHVGQTRAVCKLVQSSKSWLISDWYFTEMEIIIHVRLNILPLWPCMLLLLTISPLNYTFNSQQYRKLSPMQEETCLATGLHISHSLVMHSQFHSLVNPFISSFFVLSTFHFLSCLYIGLISISLLFTFFKINSVFSQGSSFSPVQEIANARKKIQQTLSMVS